MLRAYAIQDRDAVLRRAGQAGVEAIIVTGCSVQSSRKARDLCDAMAAASSMQAAANGGNGATATTAPLPQLYFTAGVHPHTAKECNDETIQQLEELAAHPHCVAIGDCRGQCACQNQCMSTPDMTACVTFQTLQSVT